MKIHYDCFELNGGIIFTIYEMAEKAIASDKVEGWSYRAKNKWTVHSFLNIEINLMSRAIYLWGKETPKTIYRPIYVIQPEEASSYIDHVEIESVEDIIWQIHNAIEDWAHNWPGWDDSKKSSPHETIIQSVCL